VPTTPVAPPIRRAPTVRTSGAQRAAPAQPAAAAPAQPAAAAAQPGVVELDKIPSNTQAVPADAFSYTKTTEFLQALERSLPGVSISSQTGNEFQRDINYRGFVAGPVIGTPQGLAIYQNGVRINEVFGDIVNWDLIPEHAINGMTLVPSNPIYGLNAIGGAISMQMKNGFTYHNVEGEVNGGSYGPSAPRCKPAVRSGTYPAILRLMPLMMPAGAWTRRHRCAASMPMSAPAATRLNSTLTSPGQTTPLARTRPLQCKCSRRIGRARTRCRKRRKINLLS